MKLIIRDDDTCALTRVEELEACYGRILPYAPVCLSVTPFRIPYTSEWVPKHLHGSLQPVPLESNTELVSFLKEGCSMGGLDFALHGYHHIVTAACRSGAHFDATNLRLAGREYLYGDELERKTRDGKQYLEGLLGCQLQTFVPPGNAISKVGLLALIKQDLNLVGIPGLGLGEVNRRPLDIHNAFNRMRRTAWKLRHGRSRKYPYVLTFKKNHKEVDYFTLYPETDLAELMRQFDFVRAVNGVFVLSTHYYAFAKKIRSGQTIGDALQAFLDHVAKKDGVEYIGYRDLW